MFPVFWIREFTERVPFTIAGDLFRLPVEYSTLNFWDSHNQFYSSSDTKELTVSFAAALEALSHREHFVIQFISKLDLKLFVISGDEITHLRYRYLHYFAHHHSDLRIFQPVGISFYIWEEWIKEARLPGKGKLLERILQNPI